MTLWRFPPVKPSRRPCAAHGVWLSCGTCLMRETVAAYRVSSWRRA